MTDSGGFCQLAKAILAEEAVSNQCPPSYLLPVGSEKISVVVFPEVPGMLCSFLLGFFCPLCFNLIQYIGVFCPDSITNGFVKKGKVENVIA